MKTSFIILNYKSEKYLVNCLSTLKNRAASFSHEIILINNDVDLISTVKAADNIRIINNSENIGFARACNQAAILANGDTLFFLNPDTEFITGNILDLIAPLNDSLVGISAPQLVLPNGNAQPWGAGHEITLWSTLKNKFFFDAFFNEKQGKEGLDWVSGAAFAIKKSLFDSVGGFDENFFMYFEDVDFCRRIQKLSKKIIVIPTVQVIHFGGQSSPDRKKQKNQYYASQDYYFKKHFGVTQLLILKCLRQVLIFFK